MTPIQATLHQRAEKCSVALNTIVNYKTRGHFDLQGDEELVKDNKQRGSDGSREKLFAGECEDSSRSAGCAAVEPRTVGMFTR